LPNYWKIEEIFSFIELYRKAPDELSLLTYIEALRWSTFSDREEEVSYRLQSFVTADVSPVVCNSAGKSLCERGHIDDLADLIESPSLNKKERRRLIQVLAYVRNIPETGKELEKTLKHSKKRVLLASTLEIISRFQNQFAIILSFSIIFSLLAFIIFTQLWPEFQDLHLSSFSQETLITFIIIRILILQMIILIGLYFIIRSKIDGIKPNYKLFFIVSLIFAFLIDGIQIVISYFTQPTKGDFLSRLYYSNFLSDIIWISIILIFIRLEFNKRNIIWKLLLLSIVSSISEIFVQSAISIIYPIIRRKDIWDITKFIISFKNSQFEAVRIEALLQQFNNNPFSIYSSNIVYFVLTSVIAAICLLGFLVGFRLAFKGKPKLNQGSSSITRSLLDTIELSNDELFSMMTAQSNQPVQFSKALSSLKVRLKEIRSTSHFAQKIILLFVLFFFAGLIILRAEILSHALPVPLSMYPNYYTGTLSVTWSPDKELIASVSSDGKVRVWDNYLEKMFIVYNHGNSLVEWSPNGQRLAFDSDDNSILVWSRNENKLIIYRGYSNTVGIIAWSPDGTRIASASSNNGSSSNDNTVQVWDAATGKKLITYTGHSDTINAIAWSPNGTRIASGSNDNTVQVWDAATGSEVYSCNNFNPISLAWSPDEQRISSLSGSGVVQVWKIL
jgi:WD40 repeat protein